MAHFFVVEGNIDGEVKFCEKEKTSFFTIITKNLFSAEFFYFQIQCLGKVAESVKNATDGTRVRIIGRLVQSGNRILIDADHVLIK